MNRADADADETLSGAGTQPADATLATAERRRRRHPSSHRRRHRDLTPEEDNRRRQREAIAKILPGILAVVGGATWIAGIWNVDEYQHHPKLVRVGRVFLLLGGGFYLVVLLREWILKAKAAYKERQDRVARGEVSAPRRSHRRKHRSPRPSGLRVK
jgi:hypothetical protein